jgi:outer membrane protein X
MKKILFTAVLICGLALTMQAQEFKPFRFDAGVGYGLPFSDGLDGGVQFYLEPKYEIVDKIAVGLRWEGSLFAGADINGQSVDVKLSSAYLVTGDYYLTNNKFRPFVGIGLGIYSIGGVSVGDNAVDAVDAKSNFGGLIRAGFDVSHFRLTLSYNYGGKTKSIELKDETFHYLGVTVGFYLGGGKN